ncbi:DUF429 domain-containing protein [Roseibium sp. CAU 1637]|uniref:DUF429 domain-containing protein n=1 Tax=Roseibium limicola TaxID=2816037 RepID=A0A939ES76_9HYPH|nr:DUF429 domain-containing protein [Roseibium limicola]MBO0346638.1 DUF429 domain-containing protein [Roseibium limicola]
MSGAAQAAPLVAGVDGCKGGWVAVYFPNRHPGEAKLLKVTQFADLLAPDPDLKVLAVDMPMGLPAHIGPDGRGPEKAVRKLLGERQSSVFSVPSRAAVFCTDYREACDVAQQTSEPARKVSKQCFYLFPKIREVDAVLTPRSENRIFEVHPEVAFWRLNDGAPMSLPKKVKSRANGPGLDQRQALLQKYGFTSAFLEQKRPAGVGRDDLLDAAVNSLIAMRILSGEARAFPTDFVRDGKGLRMAIWA